MYTSETRGAARSIEFALLPGDGIGPEITNAALRIAQAAGANIKPLRLPEPSQDPDRAIQAIRESGVLLKGPLEGGLPRDWPELFELSETVRTIHGPDWHLTVIRDNLARHRADPTTVPATEDPELHLAVPRAEVVRLMRRAIDWAKLTDSPKLVCVTKENLLPDFDGKMRRIFQEVVGPAQTIRHDTMLIDKAIVALIGNPGSLGAVVAPDLYGDIIGDVAARLSGKVPLVGAARLGAQVAIFEPVHGAATALAGRVQVNPSGMILATTLMLRHVGQRHVADRILTAWKATLADGAKTTDGTRKTGKRKMSCQALVRETIARLAPETQLTETAI